ncbi:hypothetical protein MMC09_001294 [Bachmanniomyces sp. S44760]|nr:hypothetical protein [Bachmanniomyces sp. S44760]
MSTDRDPTMASNARLIQTQLTKAFFESSAMKAQAASTRSPYFNKPSPSIPTESSDSPTPQSSDNPSPPINLYPERRANLSNSLSTSTPPSSSYSPPPPSNHIPTKSSIRLARVAAETKSLLPNLLRTRFTTAPQCYPYSPTNLHPLSVFDSDKYPTRPPFNFHPRYPNLPPVTITVINADSLDTAISLPPSTFRPSKPPLVLNMANAQHGGGGWLKGAMAQEEELCYRSSLSFSLKRKYYPFASEDTILYSPRVLVMRTAHHQGHTLLDLSAPNSLPLISVVSCAALRDPPTMTRANGSEIYKFIQDRETMKLKMRLVLRCAARDGHTRLVLGALGCGAFGNPKEEVVRCWREVFQDEEWVGWFQFIVFAVLSKGEKGGGGNVNGDGGNGNGNYGAFHRGLHGLVVG